MALLFFVFIACIAFAVGQITAVLAAPQTVSLDCAPVTEEWGHSNKSPGSQVYTLDIQGYCFSYYLTSSIVNNGNVYTLPGGGWSATEHLYFPASGTTAAFSTHNTYRSWYNGYVGTSDY